MNQPRYPYAGHDRGIVLTQPRNGEFEERRMTAGELAARQPALQIAKDIYRHANQAGVCYFEIWEMIAGAIDGTTADLRRQLAAERDHAQWMQAIVDEVRARSLRDQCRAAGVPFFLKQVGRYPLSDRDEGYPWAQLYDDDGQAAGQWGLDGTSKKGGEPTEWPADLRVREYPHA